MTYEVVAVEIELTLKNRTRLERILRGYLRNHNVTVVRYHAAPPIADAVQRAARAVGAEAILELAPLPVDRNVDDPEPIMSDAIVPLDHQLLTAEEVAELLRLPVSTIYDLARTGRLPHLKIGRALRFSRSDLEAHLAERCRAQVAGSGVRRLGSLRCPAVKGAAARLASLGPDGPPLTADPLRLCGNDRSAGGGPRETGLRPALCKSAGEVAGVDPDLVRQRDRQVAVAIKEPTSVDDRHADDLAVVAVPHAVTLGREGRVRRLVGLAAREVEHVAVGVVVRPVENESVDSDVH